MIGQRAQFSSCAPRPNQQRKKRECREYKRSATTKRKSQRRTPVYGMRTIFRPSAHKLYALHRPVRNEALTSVWPSSWFRTASISCKEAVMRTARSSKQSYKINQELKSGSDQQVGCWTRAGIEQRWTQVCTFRIACQFCSSSRAHGGSSSKKYCVGRPG